MEEEFLPDPIQQISIEQEIQQNKESPVIYSPVLRGSVKLPADAHIKGGQTAYNTGQGFFLGYDGTAYKFSIGDPDGDYLIWDGAGLTSNKFGTLAVVVSDNLRNSNDTERTTGATSATKVKEILVNEDMANVRIKFNMKSSHSGSPNVHAQIYKNGVVIGTQRTKAEDTWETFSEDFSNIATNDLIQIYAWVGTGTARTCYISTMRFYYNSNITHVNNYELETVLTTTRVISTTNQDP